MRSFRRRKRWSLADLADRLPVTRQQLQKVEVGKSDPGVELAVAIEELTTIPVESWPSLAAVGRLIERRLRARPIEAA